MGEFVLEIYFLKRKSKILNKKNCKSVLEILPKLNIEKNSTKKILPKKSIKKTNEKIIFIQKKSTKIVCRLRPTLHADSKPQPLVRSKLDILNRLCAKCYILDQSSCVSVEQINTVSTCAKSCYQTNSLLYRHFYVVTRRLDISRRKKI